MKFKKIIAIFIIVSNVVCLTAFANPSATTDPAEAVDKLFRELLTAPANRRGEVIETIYNFGKTMIPQRDPEIPSVSQAVQNYGLDRRNRAVLAEAIPILIDSLNGTVNNKAWWILISIQGSCPEPKKEVWEQWWKTTGQKRFTAENVKK